MLALLNAVRTELDAGSELTDWAADHGQPAPRIVIGYKQPRVAQDWPFVALLCSGDRRGFGNHREARLLVTVVCGVRDTELSDSDASGGYHALAELDAALLRRINAGNGFKATGWCASAKESRLVDVDLAHPNYQIERVIEFTARIVR